MLFSKPGKNKTAKKAKKYTVCYCRPFKYMMTNLSVKKVEEQCPPQTFVILWGEQALNNADRGLHGCSVLFKTSQYCIFRSECEGSSWYIETIIIMLSDTAGEEQELLFSSQKLLSFLVFFLIVLINKTSLTSISSLTFC